MLPVLPAIYSRPLCFHHAVSAAVAIRLRFKSVRCVSPYITTSTLHTLAFCRSLIPASWDCGRKRSALVLVDASDWNRIHILFNHTYVMDLRCWNSSHFHAAVFVVCDGACAKSQLLQRAYYLCPLLDDALQMSTAPAPANKPTHSFKAVAKMTVAAQRFAKAPVVKAHGHKTELILSRIQTDGITTA